MLENIYGVCVILGGFDYIPGPYNVTIPAGKISVSFEIPITDDDILEADESFSLVIIPESLPNLFSRGNPGVVMVTIMNNDGKLIKYCNCIQSAIALIEFCQTT